jgi:hypothetical protein
MRTVLGVLGSITLLVVGVFALSEQAQQVKDAAVTNGTNATESAYNTTSTVFEGVTQAAGPGVVWMGVAAVVLVALGFLVYAGSSGR